MTWWAWWVLVIWLASMKEFAVPDLAMSASIRAFVRPLSSNQSPSNFNVAISMCRLPIMITKWSSPWVAGQFHWTSFTRAYRCWSAATQDALYGYNNARALTDSQNKSAELFGVSLVTVSTVIQTVAMNTSDTRNTTTSWKIDNFQESRLAKVNWVFQWKGFNLLKSAVSFCPARWPWPSCTGPCIIFWTSLWSGRLVEKSDTNDDIGTSQGKFN